MSEEAQQFYTSINTFTEAVENGTTDLEKILSFIFNYKEALKTETIQRAENLAEKYVAEIVPDVLILIDSVKRDMRVEFGTVHEEDEAVDIEAKETV